MRSRWLIALAIGALFASACSQPPARPDNGPRPPPRKKPGAITLTLIGTNDLHGALERLPVFAGYVANVREARRADGGGVVLVDAGDMFQGTLESNLSEGTDVVRAYNQIGYAAAAVGNHEFDYGPDGPAVTASSVEEDPRGALKKRAQEAKFPFLVSNVLDKQSGSRIKWPNMPASTLIEVAGVKIGIIGATTEATPATMMPAHFVGLEMRPAAGAIAEEAKQLRTRGAAVIVVAAHIGSMCKNLDRPNDISSCNQNEELFHMIKDLPGGMIDAIVAGHTHAAMAHRVSDIAVIESYSSGKAFGRIDLRISPTGHVTSVKVFKPQVLCPGEGELPMPVASCKPAPYEGRPVVPDPAVQLIVDEALAKAGARRGEKLGVKLMGPVTKSYDQESVQGNWLTDLMLAAQPAAQVALANGGGLRADIPAGELTYGQLFEAIPFDNRFALIDLKGSHLRTLVTSNLQRGGAIHSWGGLAARAKCTGNKLDVSITVAGKPLVETASYKLVTNDYVGSGGTIGRLKLPEGSVKMTDSLMREVIADVLRKKKGSVDPAKYSNPKRLDYPGKRPVQCGKSSTTAPDKEPTE